LPLERGKTKLKRSVARTEGMHVAEHVGGNETMVFEHARKLGLEDIVS
jgi:hypothetical protein